MNCWEFMKCGREIFGTKAKELGICPAYPDHGTRCAQVAGTLCGGKVKSAFAMKCIKCMNCLNCMQCDFYKSENHERTCKG